MSLHIVLVTQPHTEGWFGWRCSCGEEGEPTHYSAGLARKNHANHRDLHA